MLILLNLDFFESILLGKGGGGGGLLALEDVQGTHSQLTGPYQTCYVPVTGHFSIWDLLDCAIHSLEESFCFVGPGHDGVGMM